MGSSVSAILAILFMDKLEKKALLSFQHIGLYARYVDDIFTLVMNHSEAENLLNLLKHQQESIKFEVEHPNEDNSLSLLDFNFQISGDKAHFNFYRKFARKDVIINFENALSFKRKIQSRPKREKESQRDATSMRREAFTTTNSTHLYSFLRSVIHF